MTDKQAFAVIVGFALTFIFGLTAGHHVGHQAGYGDGVRHMLSVRACGVPSAVTLSQ